MRSMSDQVPRTLADLVPFPLVVVGRNGFWGASARLVELTRELQAAIAAGEPRRHIVVEIGEELFNERAPTPDEMDFDEDAYWERQRELQQLRWEAEADEHVDWVEGTRMTRDYNPAAVEDRIELVLQLATRYGQIDGEHHKLWVIDQMVRVLAGDRYEAMITSYCAGEDGPDTYMWDTGIAP